MSFRLGRAGAALGAMALSLIGGLPTTAAASVAPVGENRPAMQALDGTLSLSPGGNFATVARIPRANKFNPDIDARLTLVDLRTRQSVELPGTLPNGQFLSWSPNGRFLAYWAVSGQGRATLRIWDTERRAQIAESRSQCELRCAKAVWLPDSTRLLFVTSESGEGVPAGFDQSQRRPEPVPDFELLDNELTGGRTGQAGVTVLQSPRPARLTPSTNGNQATNRPTYAVVLLQVATGGERVIARGDSIADFDISPAGDLAVLVARVAVSNIGQNSYAFYRLPLLSLRSSVSRTAQSGPVDESGRPLAPLGNGSFAMSGAANWSFSHSGNQIAVIGRWSIENTAQSTFGDAYVVSLGDGGTRNLTHSVPIDQESDRQAASMEQRLLPLYGKFAGRPFWTLDDDALILNRVRAGSGPQVPLTRQLWLSRVTTGATRQLSPQGTSVLRLPSCGIQSACFTADHGVVLALWNYETQTQEIASLSLTSGDMRAIRKWAPRSIGPLGVTTMDHLTVGAAGTTKLLSLEEDTSHPQEAWLVHSEAGAQEAQNLGVLNPGQWPRSRVELRYVNWTAPDGTIRSAALRLPVDRAVGATVPMIVDVYWGGLDYREFANRYQAWDNFTDPLLAHGYAVLTPDIPWSAGPGRACDTVAASAVAATDAAVATGTVDSGRVGIFGYSWGGYIANCIVTRTQRFRAAVSGGGFGDLISFALNQGEVTFNSPNVAISGPPWDVPELYVSDSPIFHLNRVETPILLMFGKRDVRARETLVRMFMGLSQLGKTAELVAFDGWDHSVVVNPEYMRRANEWYDRFLRSSATNPSP